MHDFDVILAGGGLANCLIADRLAAARPELKVVVVEAGDHLGGDHTWSFHATDVTPEQDAWLRPMARAVWDGQEVRFPSYQRHLTTGYRTIVSSSLNERVSAAGPHVMLLTRVASMDGTGVVLEGGREIKAPCVIDGRGLSGMPGLSIGYQKFFGLEVELDAPHGLAHPVLMDTTVDQIDGYRFLYCLPYTPTSLLVEDTYYSDGPEVDTDVLGRRVMDYIATQGWNVARVTREERGVLPVVLDGSLAMVWPDDEAGSAARSGMRSGLFHQTTGYSLPFAARTADRIASLDELSSASVSGALRKLAQGAWERQVYFRLLNRFLFIASQGAERRRIFERFYRLPQSLIERFYAADLKTRDKLRIVFGRPPVSLTRALGAIPPAAAAPRAQGRLPGVN
jgi:lycopene beta-cyclase